MDYDAGYDSVSDGEDVGRVDVSSLLERETDRPLLAQDAAQQQDVVQS
jgi:hypothetical protein